MISPVEMIRRRLTRSTHRIHSLPIVTLMPHSRCNCRCVMCDIWKANRNRVELTREDLAQHVDAFRRLHVQQVVLSGGEALMHSNLWTLCAMLSDLGAKITLLSTGLLLESHAGDVVSWCDEVIVSLDGSQPVHNAIRNIPRAYERLASGVAALKAEAPSFPVRARTVIQRANYADLPNIIQAAHALKLDQISLFAVDVSSTAFNRPKPWEVERVSEVALSREEVADFSRIVEQIIETHRADFSSGFIAESPDKLRRLPRYFAALNGDGDFPPVQCNAPWVSAVIEANGTVRPCFFHEAHGNIHDQPLVDILNGEQAVAFRQELDVANNPVCRRCTCSLNLGLRTSVKE